MEVEYIGRGEGSQESSSVRMETRKEKQVVRQLESQRKAAQSAVHFAKLRRLEEDHIHASVAEGFFQEGISSRKQKPSVHEDAICSIRFLRVNGNDLISRKSGMRGEDIPGKKSLLPEKREATFQMEYTGNVSYIDRSGRTAILLQDLRKLPGSFCICALREADEHFPIRHTDVSPFKSPGRIDGIQRRIQTAQRSPDRGYLTLTARGSRMRENRSLVCKHGCVLDKRTVGKPFVRGEGSQFQPALLQRPTIRGVLFNRSVDIRRAQSG
jgi:hypothetical protein